VRLFNQDDIPAALGEQRCYRCSSRAATDHQDITSGFPGCTPAETV